MPSEQDHQIPNTMQRAVPGCSLRLQRFFKVWQASLRKNWDDTGQARKLGLGGKG